MTDGPFGSNLKSSHYVDSGPRVIRLQNIGFGEFIDGKAHISEEHFEALRSHEARAGDLVVASLGQDLPRACLIPPALGPAIVKADCIRVRLHPRVDARYVNYGLQRPELRQAVADQIHGVGRPRLSMAGIKDLSIPLAPRPEQERIVSAIEEQLPGLDAAKAAVGSAQLRVGALYQALLSRAQAEGEEVALNDLLVDIEAGKSFKTPGRRAHADEWGVIKVSAMTWGEFDENENKAIPTGRPADPRHEIRAGDLLLSRANTSEYVGATVLVAACRRRLLLSDKSMRLLTRDGVERRWLRFALASTQVRSQMSELATGTSDSMRNISQAKVRGLRIRVPDADRQKKLADEIEEALRASGLLEVELSTARRRAISLRRSILEAAFAGRLVAQDTEDEPAAVLLERIRAERAAISPTRRPLTQAASQ